MLARGDSDFRPQKPGLQGPQGSLGSSTSPAPLANLDPDGTLVKGGHPAVHPAGGWGPCGRCSWTTDAVSIQDPSPGPAGSTHVATQDRGAVSHVARLGKPGSLRGTMAGSEDTRGASSRGQGLSVRAGSPRTVTAAAEALLSGSGPPASCGCVGTGSGPTGQEPADQRPGRSRCAATARVDTTAGRRREVLSGQLRSGLLPGVPLPVTNEAGAVGEGFPAFLALVGLLSSVSFLMF